ncbi:hypothetical protein FGIG_08970, partial [Fasciola gigantica]
VVDSVSSWRCCINSVAQTNLGTKTYLAPERIECSGNQGYRIQSDVWSLGLTVMELATGKPCYPGTNDVFQQLELIIPCILGLVKILVRESSERRLEVLSQDCRRPQRLSYKNHPDCHQHAPNIQTPTRTRLRTSRPCGLVKDEQKRANYVQLMKTDFLQQVDLESGREELVLFFNTYMGPTL